MKKPPIRLSGDIGKVIDDIYSHINSLDKRVSTSQSSEGSQKPSEQEGTMRVVKDSEGVYKLQIKSKDGWVESSDSTLSLKEK